jgi:MFS family permease
MIVAGTLMMGALLSGGGALMSTFQDYIPKGSEGRFQGVRMCFTVLLPMLIGPLITMCLNLDKIDDSAPTFAPPFEIFLAATIVAILAIVPIVFVMKDSTKLREKKLQESLESQATDSLDSTDADNMTKVCTCGEDGCNCPFDCNEETQSTSSDEIIENQDDLTKTPVEAQEIIE